MNGVEGPGITFEVSTIQQCESWQQENYNGSFWISVDYLCGNFYRTNKILILCPFRQPILCHAQTLNSEAD